MQVKDYWQLTSDERLGLLSALVHTAADTEVVRQHLQDTGTELMNDQLGRGLPIGVDDTGTSYYQLASDAGTTPPLAQKFLSLNSASLLSANLHLILFMHHIFCGKLRKNLLHFSV